MNKYNNRKALMISFQLFIEVGMGKQLAQVLVWTNKQIKWWGQTFVGAGGIGHKSLDNVLFFTNDSVLGKGIIGF